MYYSSRLLTLLSRSLALQEPKFIVPEHDYSKRPLQLFWLDGLALQAIAESDEQTYLMTQVSEENDAKEQNVPNSSNVDYPLRPLVASVGDFRTTPAIHMGYAVTWFGLSAAGIYMTRKLISRGRF
jgi:surfeit locus 1 family protein